MPPWSWTAPSVPLPFDPFDDTKPGAPGATIAGYLLGVGPAGASEDQPVAHHGAAHAGKVRRTGAATRARLGEDLLGQPVLAGVVADDGTAATDGEAIQCDREGVLELAERAQEVALGA